MQALAFFSALPSHTQSSNPLVHLVTLVLIFCVNASWTSSLLRSSQLSHTVQCNNPPFTYFPCSIPEDFGKGVSALVSPQGETATDSKRPHCLLNLSWKNKQVLHFYLSCNSSLAFCPITASCFILKLTLFSWAEQVSSFFK